MIELLYIPVHFGQEQIQYLFEESPAINVCLPKDWFTPEIQEKFKNQEATNVGS